jgi:hypothetical protein
MLSENVEILACPMSRATTRLRNGLAPGRKEPPSGAIGVSKRGSLNAERQRSKPFNTACRRIR